MADDLGERSEQATPRRRQEAREEGNVSRSQDFAAALMLLAVTAVLWSAAMPMLETAARALRQALDVGFLSDPVDPAATLQFAAHLAGDRGPRRPAWSVMVAWLAGYLAHLLQVGWLFSVKTLQPRPAKLNPITGFRRVFGLSGLVKATLDALKVVVVVAVAVVTIIQYERDVIVLPYLTAMQALGSIGWLMLDLAFRVLGVLLLLGVLDLLYQRWKHSQDLKMTKQQVKDEMKQTEGDPDTKRRRMRMQQQIAMQRMGAAVPKADVIVTNPEHISVAIQYDAETMRAPKVIAKGAELLALRIRQIAMKHDVPIVERKPLARALYRQVEVGQEIPPTFYKAVAEILAYVYQLNGKVAS